MSRLFFILVSIIFVAHAAVAAGHCESAPWTKNKCAYADRGRCEMAGLSVCRWIAEEAKGVCQPANGSRSKCHFADRWSCELRGPQACRWTPGITQSDASRAEIESSTHAR